MKTTRLLLLMLGMLFCISSLFAAEPPPVRLVYFVPADRTPCKDYEERLDRTMKHVQEFYRKGMEENGFGPMSFSLERDDNGKLKFYMVDAKGPMEDYGRNDSSKVRREVASVMREKYGINIDRETIIIFQLLLKWEDGKATEIGPYVGGGSSLSGTAWVYDDDRLDSDLLSSKEPGGYYHRAVSLGKFNTTYVGGLAHELGHAFSLPHDCEKSSERSKGRSLMGSGNHTYGENLRGEGNGTFLSGASAYRLQHIRAFAGDLPDARENARWEVSDLDVAYENGKLKLAGKVKATPPLSSVIAYNDFGGVAADYDAITWVCPIKDMKAGDTVPFKFEIDQLQPGDWQMRLYGTHTNGRTSRMVLDYKVNSKGEPDLTEIMSEAPLKELAAAFFARENAKMDSLSEKLLKDFPESETIKQKLEILKKLRNPAKPLALKDVPTETKEIEISKLEFANARTGWGAIRRDHVPEELFLQSNGKVYSSGLYAHAPAVYGLDLNGDWKKLKTGYGLQDGHGGSAVFVVKGDGKELFRSGKIQRPNQAGEKEIDIEGIKKLELIVEDAEDGNRADWGVWLEPKLER